MTARTNVYILPGFMGSTLEQTYTAQPNIVRWYNPAGLVVEGAGRLQLAPDGVSPGPLAEGPLIATGPVDLGIYETLLTSLANDGYNPIFYPYDWRLSVLSTGAGFGNYLIQKQTATPYYVIGHSMGGLLARVAYASLPASPLKTNWARSVYLGTPHGGTYIAAQYLAGQAPPGWPLVVLFNAGFRGVGHAGVLGLITRQSNAQLLETLASWPALYECLPSNLGQWEGDDPNLAALYIQPTYNATNPYVTQTRLTAAQATIATLQNDLGFARPPEVCVVGTGQITPAFILQPVLPANLAGYITQDEGDSVTTVERGTLVGVNNESITADHYGVANGGTVLAQLPNLLANGLIADVVIPPFIVPPAPALPPETEWHGSGASIEFDSKIIHGDP